MDARNPIVDLQGLDARRTVACTEKDTPGSGVVPRCHPVEGFAERCWDAEAGEGVAEASNRGRTAREMAFWESVEVEFEWSAAVEGSGHLEGEIGW